MRILHILPSGEMGWCGGIHPTLRRLADSALGERYSFALAGLIDFPECLQEMNPDLLVWHGACSWKALPRLRANRNRRQILVEHHYSAGFERHNVPSTLRFRTMLRLCYGAMQKVIAVSRAQCHWMEEARLIQPSDRQVLLSSRPLDAFLSLPFPSFVSSRPFSLLAYGRFTPQKGFDRLIRALHLLPAANVRLMLAGDGPQAAELAALADADPRIALLGPRNDIPDLLAQADAVVIPSRWEPWGNVCLEARASGRPVVVNGVDGLPEQVDGSGLVVKADSEEALAETLDSLLTATSAQRRSWGIAGRVSAQYAWDHYLDAWNLLLEDGA